MHDVWCMIIVHDFEMHSSFFHLNWLALMNSLNSADSTKAIEFFPNDFLWIQWIQWIMTKSESSMVTRNILYLAIDTFLDLVVKYNFSLLSVGWYLFWGVSGNRYLPRSSNENGTLYYYHWQCIC